MILNIIVITFVVVWSYGGARFYLDKIMPRKPKSEVIYANQTQIAPNFVRTVTLKYHKGDY